MGKILFKLIRSIPAQTLAWESNIWHLRFYIHSPLWTFALPYDIWTTDVIACSFDNSSYHTFCVLSIDEIIMLEYTQMWWWAADNRGQQGCVDQLIEY